MSRVTGCVICASCGERENLLEEINKWLDGERTGWRLNAIDDHAGGSKYPQMHIWAGGFNHFESSKDDFVEFVLGLNWEYKENLVIVLQPEESESLIYHF